MMSVIVIGAGLAGLSAACTLAENGIAVDLVSKMPSERSQSTLAEGGINASLDTMGEGDSPEGHYADTMRGGCNLADPAAVRTLSERAPEILRFLDSIGAPLHREGGQIALRPFGGQKKRRTAYAKSSTGKILMTAMIDAVRKYECMAGPAASGSAGTAEAEDTAGKPVRSAGGGLVTRYPHHDFTELLLEDAGGTPLETELKTAGGQDAEGADGRQAAGGDGDFRKVCRGVRIRDTYTSKIIELRGPVILASGGMNGMFPQMTTGTTLNTADVTATVFTQGVRLSNLEMIQYHPTTIGVAGKRLLVSEAARGEGGRLFVKRGGENWYFMEELYPELGNLMPRDVVAREMYFVVRREDCGDQVYLDMTHLSDSVWSGKLSDLRSEIIDYMAIDPKKESVPVDPGIHYFMGGIDTNERHETNVKNLFAAGECTSRYHGANRLGGNSMLGALLGGRIAAESVAAELKNESRDISAALCAEPGKAVSEPSCPDFENAESGQKKDADAGKTVRKQAMTGTAEERPGKERGPEQRDAPCAAAFSAELRDILLSALGIVRNEKQLTEALEELDALEKKREINSRERAHLLLGRAMLLSARARKESRGAHYREDFPKTEDKYLKKSVAVCDGGSVSVSFASPDSYM